MPLDPWIMCAINEMNSSGPMTPQGMIEEANENFNAAFTSFETSFSGDSPSSYFCFVEGYDRDYYYSKVSAIAGNDNIFIRCGCKRNVILMHARISEDTNYSAVKAMYFVDKDYDENSGLSDDIFVTDYYSIENYYCSHRVIDNVLQTLAHMDPEKDRMRFDNIHADFDKWIEEFMTQVKPFCAWYMSAHKRHINKDKIDYKDHFPTRLATIEFRGITSVSDYTLATLNSFYAPVQEVTRQEYEANLSSITTTNEIRGKFVIQFMDSYILHLDKTAKKNGQWVVRPFGYQNHRPSAMGRLVGCTETPDRLRSYILSRL